MENPRDRGEENSLFHIRKHIFVFAPRCINYKAKVFRFFFFVFIASGFKAKQKISFLVSLWVIKWIYEGFYEFRFVLMWRDNNFGLDCC
jgi:hypothetical protein